MVEQFSYDVFLSHSAKDKSVVRPIAERLRADGLKVWLDEWMLKPGDDVAAKIEEGLEQSRALMLCTSAHAFGAEWAQLEGQTFRFRDPQNSQRRFIPLRLDDATIRGSLAHFPYIDWNVLDRDHEYAKLLEACRPAISKAAEQGTNSKRFLERVIELEDTRPTWAYLFSPNGKRVLTAGDDVRLWDLETGHCVVLPVIPTRYLTCPGATINNGRSLPLRITHCGSGT